MGWLSPYIHRRPKNCLFADEIREGWRLEASPDFWVGSRWMPPLIQAESHERVPAKPKEKSFLPLDRPDRHELIRQVGYAFREENSRAAEAKKMAGWCFFALLVMLFAVLITLVVIAGHPHPSRMGMEKQNSRSAVIFCIAEKSYGGLYRPDNPEYGKTSDFDRRHGHA